MHPDLAAHDHWICWGTISRGGKETKVPRLPFAAGDDHTDPANQTDFETVAEYDRMVSQWGVGFVFRADGPFVGVDLDDCRDPTDGTIDEWALDIVDTLDAPTEVSPSGTGLHIYCRGSLDGALKNDTRGIELYDRERFFTVTGAWLGDGFAVDAHVPERDDALGTLVAEYQTADAAADAHTTAATKSADAADGGGDHGPLPPAEVDPLTKLHEISVAQLYTFDRETRVPHPVHGSTTNANFKIVADGDRAVCYRGEHQYGGTQSCGLNAAHLLAMHGSHRCDEVGGIDACDRVRRDWAAGDLVFCAWIEAITRGLIDPHPVPLNALVWVGRQYGLDGVDDDGREFVTAVKSAARIVRSKYDIDLDVGQIP